MSSLKELFFVFLRIGAFTFGGGYAMIPLVHKEVVENKQWISDEEMLDMLIIAESTPGPLAINSATYIGYRLKGVKGALAATLGVVLPSFTIIIAIAIFFMSFRDNFWINKAFLGIRAGVIVLIFNAVFKLGKKIPKTWFSIILLTCAALTSLLLNINVIYILIISSLVGILYGNILIRKSGDVQ